MTSSNKKNRGRPSADCASGASELLKCARRIFAKRGFDAASVREIARDANVDPALISHHFGSKEAIWIAVLAQIVEQMSPLITATRALRSAEMPPRKRIEAALKMFIDKVFLEPDIGMFFSTAATEEGERLDAIVEGLVRPYRLVFVPLLEDASAAGELALADADVMFSMMVNAITKTVAYSHLLAIFSSLPSDPGKFKQMVLETSVFMLGGPQ